MDSPTDRKSKFEVMEEMVAEVRGQMEDLCQSGFDTVHDATLQDMRKAAELAGQYGMEYLSGLLGDLAEEISQGRHRMERETGRMAELYTSLQEYLYLCGQKAAYDRGLNYYDS